MIIDLDIDRGLFVDRMINRLIWILMLRIVKDCL